MSICRRQLTLSSAVYSPPRPSRALFESSRPPSVRPHTSRPGAGVGLHRTEQYQNWDHKRGQARGPLSRRKEEVKAYHCPCMIKLPPWTSHKSLSSSPSLKGPAKAPPTSCRCSSSRLICGAWGSSGNMFVVTNLERRRGERRESKIVNGQTGDYSNVIVAEEENNHWLPPTYSPR